MGAAPRNLRLQPVPGFGMVIYVTVAAGLIYPALAFMGWLHG